MATGYRFASRGLLVVLVGCTLAVWSARGQDDINQPPINYDSTPTKDAIARLQQRLEAGEIKFHWDERHGWLPSLLDALEIPISSQLLVFSKTSLQTSKISPRRPRAIYFNDEAYVGAVQHGGVLELSAVDPQQGAMFYSLDQKQAELPRIRRTSDKCLACHESRRTQGVPGYFLRSVYPSKSGHPYFDLGTITTDQTTDLRKRFGGWYLTGNHGDLRHRGNVIADKEADPPLDVEPGANLTDLTTLIDTDDYLSAHSDLVAAMVLEHQAQMHNFITRATYEARRVEHYDGMWNKILERPAGFISEVSRRRISAAGEALLEYLLFSGEFRLTSPLAGSSEFAAEFQALGLRDSKGRSLRDLDLKTRLFKYPCSFLIHSDSFAAIPKVMRDYLDRRLEEILNGEDTSEKFAHLTKSDRTAIHEILSETLPGN